MRRGSRFWKKKCLRASPFVDRISGTSLETGLETRLHGENRFLLMQLPVRETGAPEGWIAAAETRVAAAPSHTRCFPMEGSACSRKANQPIQSRFSPI
jgi:hypothetical protein